MSFILYGHEQKTMTIWKTAEHILLFQKWYRVYIWKVKGSNVKCRTLLQVYIKGFSVIQNFLVKQRLNIHLVNFLNTQQLHTVTGSLNQHSESL